MLTVAGILAIKLLTRELVDYKGSRRESSERQYTHTVAAPLGRGKRRPEDGRPDQGPETLDGAGPR